MKESKTSATTMCLFWAEPLQEKHEPADETAAAVMQGLGEVNCDERWKHLQVCGAERFERCMLAFSKGIKSPHKGEAVDFMSVRNTMWLLVRHLKGFEHKDN